MKRIPFSEAMREAILDGWKTETRRLAGSRPCPYKVGDILGVGEPHKLWVMERSRLVDVQDFGSVEFSAASRLICSYQDGARRDIALSEAQEAQQRAHSTVGIRPATGAGRPARLRSSRFLPDAFVRLQIRVLKVHQELLQDMTPESARREGAPELSGFPAFHERGPQCYVHWFRSLWDSLHKTAGTRWADNPPIHVVQFETIDPLSAGRDLPNESVCDSV